MSESKHTGALAPDPKVEPIRRGSSGRWIIGSIIAFLSGLVVLLTLQHFGIIHFPWVPRPAPIPSVSGSIKQGSPGMTHAEILTAMQAEADRSRISIAINARPVFEDGLSEGLLYIINPVRNAYYMEYKITLDQTGQLIYQTPKMAPNTYIDNDKLSINLPKGEYAATAHIFSYHPENLDDPLSRNTASLIITIKNESK